MAGVEGPALWCHAGRCCGHRVSSRTRSPPSSGHPPTAELALRRDSPVPGNDNCIIPFKTEQDKTKQKTPSFNFEIIAGLQKSYKNTTKNSRTPFTKIPQMLTFYQFVFSSSLSPHLCSGPFYPVSWKTSQETGVTRIAPAGPALRTKPALGTESTVWATQQGASRSLRMVPGGHQTYRGVTS